MKKKNENREILENLHIDLEEFLVDVQFNYQHSPNYNTNPNAFTKTNDTGDWIMSCCPNHPETRASFGISKEPPYHGNCFYCGYLGTIDEVLEIAFELDSGEGVGYLLSNYLVEESRTVVDVGSIIDNGRFHDEIPCLEETELGRFDSSSERNPWKFNVALSYLRNARHLTDSTISTYEVKVDIDNECLVFPQRTREGKLRFLQKRKVGDRYRGVKFINEGSPVKKDILFGLSHINRLRMTPHRLRRVRLVESPIDVLSNYQVGIPAVGQNGKILFHNQIRELQLAGIEVVDLFFDNDAAGRQATKDATKKLVRAGFVVNHVLYPPQLRRDPNHDSNTLLKLGLLDQLETVPFDLVKLH